MSNSKRNGDYGPVLKSGKAELYSMDIFGTSRREKSNGRKGIPITAWGEAGIGKTELPNSLVKKYADFFGGDSKKGIPGNIAYVPMAQIEEKAELQGLPDLQQIKRKAKRGEKPVGSEIEITEDVDGKPVRFILESRTIYATPSWIPQVETHGEKGLLVIDDMNRADSRIIQSIMQLLQDGKLLGWSLPEGWEIYCTCNPANGDYDVTPFDGAQMTRMANFYQTFDAKAWLTDWAIPTGLHPAAQNFVMMDPDMIVKGERTNPRSFDKFFRMIHDLLDQLNTTAGDVTLKGDSDVAGIARRINEYGKMNIETQPLQAFINFITSGYSRLPDVEEIISEKFDIKGFYDKIKVSGYLKLDILASLNMRLNIYLNDNADELSTNKKAIKGIQTWINYPEMPQDLRYNTATEIADNLPEAIDAQLLSLVYSSVS